MAMAMEPADVVMRFWPCHATHMRCIYVCFMFVCFYVLCLMFVIYVICLAMYFLNLCVYIPRRTWWPCPTTMMTKTTRGLLLNNHNWSIIIISMCLYYLFIIISVGAITIIIVIGVITLLLVLLVVMLYMLYYIYHIRYTMYYVLYPILYYTILHYTILYLVQHGMTVNPQTKDMLSIV